MKNILLVVAILFLITSIGYCQESKQPLQRFDKSSPLELTIKSDKKVYKVGEEVEIEVRFNNISDNHIYLGLRELSAPNWLLKVAIEDNEKCREIGLADLYMEKMGTEAFHLVGSKGSYRLYLKAKIEMASSFFPKFYKEPEFKYKSGYLKEENIGIFDRKGMIITYFKKDDILLYPENKSFAFVLGNGGRFNIKAEYDSGYNDCCGTYIHMAKELKIDSVFEGTLVSNTITIEALERKDMTKEEAIRIAQKAIRELKDIDINKYYLKDIKEFEWKGRDIWRLTFDLKEKLKPRIRMMGGEIFVNVDKKTGEAEIRYGE